jgi:membrane-associated protease RseP (regulator of RpoE activity)
VAKQFVLVRITRMRGIDLDLFDFDYDLTWMGFFLNADGMIYGRYGGRDAESADSRTSLAGLRYALEAALMRHRRIGMQGEKNHKPGAPAAGQPVAGAPGLSGAKPPRTVEQYPAARRLPERACIHCHQVYDLRRESLQAAGKWRLDKLWVYPLPENIGLTLEVDRGDRVARVEADSLTARAGIQVGDRLLTIDNRPIASFADAQYALHRAPTQGTLAITWEHDKAIHSSALSLAEGWRKTDISWRWSLRGVDPKPWVQGDDLSAEEKKALDLSAKHLAFRQGPFVSEPAQRAGIRQNDIILGVDGKILEMSERQFGAYIRLNYRVGDRVTYNILRRGQRLVLPLTLTARP